MRVRKKIINIFAIVICCKMLVFPVAPAHAGWPSISWQAVASFISTGATAASQIGISDAEVDNYIKTIITIGDQVSTIAKYATDIKNNIENIKQAVEQIVVALTRSAKEMDELLAESEKTMEEGEDAKEEIAEKAVDTVEEQTNDDEEKSPEDTEDGEDENEEIDPDVLKEFIEETKETDKNVNESFNDVKKRIEEKGKEGEEILNKLIEVINSSNLSDEEKAQLIKQIEETKQTLAELQKDMLDALEAMQKDYNENSAKILNAYQDYQQAIADYNAGKITKEELSAKGQTLKDVAKQAKDDTNYGDVLNKISQQVDDAVNSIEEMQETIMNTLANDKDYPEVMINIKDTPQKFAFSFQQKTENINLKGCYADKSDKCKLYQFKNSKENRFFLISKELTADKSGKRTVKDPDGQCQELKFKDIEDGNQNLFTAKMRDCLTRANTDKTYFWPEIGSEEELAKKNIFTREVEPNFYQSKEDSYEKKGVYRHIAEDYAGANIINSYQNRQYARSWLGNSKDAMSSELNKFIRQFKNISDTRNAYIHLGLIELEYLKMFSRLRRVDAVNRAKKAVDVFRPLRNLYIDGRDEDFKAANHNPGKNDIPIGAVKEKLCSDCGEKVITIISNVFPYFCGYGGGSGGSFSLAYASKNDAGAMASLEEGIKECIKTYVEPATNGTIKGQRQLNPDGGTKGANNADASKDGLKRLWRINETKAMTDSLMQTFVLSTINLYRSSKDFVKKLASQKDININSLYEDLGKSKTSRNDYGACARINHYGAHQLLTIVDADAQALQSEILVDMLNVTLDYFDDENANANMEALPKGI